MRTNRRIFRHNDERPLYRALAVVEDQLGASVADDLRRLLYAYGQDQRTVGYRQAQQNVVAFVPEPYDRIDVTDGAGNLADRGIDRRWTHPSEDPEIRDAVNDHGRESVR